jgi:DNA modification methylase
MTSESFVNRVFFGDCRDSMRTLIAQGVKVQMCVTSPPYFGLRDYGHSGQIGLEKTVGEFVSAMVEVFGLVAELLSDDGVLWLNLGDSYNASGRQGHGTRVGCKQWTNRASAAKVDQSRPSVATLKPKDLIGVPWRVAFALQESGWYLRQDIIWHKPNPMPESVTDRCTSAHEYLFLLSKNERYYYDAESIKETAKYPGDNRAQRSDTRKSSDPFCADGGSRKKTGNPTGERINKRSVWTVKTEPYSEAHFATFPTKLIEPCILAGSRQGDTILDPFFGSGTTGQVAQKLGRQWIGCEINENYNVLQKQRTAQGALILQ